MVRIGILGAARIAPKALVEPARRVPGAEAVAVAARERGRAERFAREHGVPRVFDDYEALIASDAVDAVYVALPIAHHARWTLRALEAGKHVLVEKAFASNAGEAERMAEAASRAGRVAMEAFHWRYHPLAERLIGIVRGGALGRLAAIRAHFQVPRAGEDDIRLHYATGGGATMDLGCYPIHMLRHLTGEEPEVVEAEAEVGPPEVDLRMRATMRLPGGARGEIACSLRAQDPAEMELHAEGSRGRLRAVNVVAPQIGHRLDLEVDGVRRSETLEGEPTFVGQLRAFVRAVEEGAPVPTDADDAVRTLRVIDAVYRAAGLRLRGEGEAR